MLFLLFLLSSSLTANASDTTITFIQHQYGDIIEMAEKERKDILLYFHFTGCGACRLMEKTTFKDPQVIEYFQKHFINAEVNTLEGIGVETNKIFNVQLHPTFIFLDDSGNELHRIVGKFTPEEFLNHAQLAIKSPELLSLFSRKIQSRGTANSEFLLEYIYLLRDAVLLDSTMIHEYLHSIQPESYEMEKNIRFIYEFCIYRNRIITPLASPAFQFLYQNKEKFYNHFEKDQVDARIVRIINQAIYQAIEEQDEAAFNNGLDLIREYDTGQQYEYKEMDGRVTANVIEYAFDLICPDGILTNKGRHRSVQSRSCRIYAKDMERLAPTEQHCLDHF